MSYSTTTRAVGSTLTASIYNSDHANHPTNHLLTTIDGFSANVGQMQTVRDPFAGDAEQLAISGAEEFTGKRWQIETLIQKFNPSATEWYHKVTDNAPLMIEGAQVVSATALPLLPDGGFNDVTGATTIETMDTVGVGTIKVLKFTGALLLTHHATNLILPDGVSLTTVANDVIMFREYATGDWELIGSNLTKRSLSAFRAPVTSTSVDSATETQVAFTTEDFDTGGEFASHVFTPKSGTYFLHACVAYQTAIAADAPIRLSITKNGATTLLHTKHSMVGSAGSQKAGIEISAIVEANGTDAFGVSTWQSSGATRSLQTGTTDGLV